MKRLSISFIVLLFALSGISQCLPQGINFITQSQIDSFQINYPNCRKIEGNVIIGSYSCDISNLNGLSQLDSIGGYCSITYTNALVDLTGLSSLKYIANGFAMQNNSALKDFSGIDSLKCIGGPLDIYGNSRITSLVGFEGIESILGYIYIRSNDSLTSLLGIDNINVDSLQAFWVDSNPMLTNCAIHSVCDYLNNTFHHADFTNNSNGCNSEWEVDSVCATVFVGELTADNGFSIYPNPAARTVTILSNSLLKECTLSIYNMSGQEIIQTMFTMPKKLITIETLPAGIYFVKLSYQTVVANLKFIKN